MPNKHALHLNEIVVDVGSSRERLLDFASISKVSLLRSVVLLHLTIPHNINLLLIFIRYRKPHQTLSRDKV